MKRHPHLVGLALCGALFVATASAKAEQLVKVVDHPIMSATTLSLEEVRRRVVLAATKRGWSIEGAGQRQLTATIAASGGQYQAVVAITYTNTAYSIELVESKGFGQRGDQINGRANRWIRNLERDIEVILASPA
jgi:hypothetical protein